MSESITFNEDCMEVMRRYPDKYFFTIGDPPYGLSITARHKAPQSGADTHTQAQRSLAEPDGLSAVCGSYGKGRPPIGGAEVARVQAAAKSSKSIQNFILCSTTAPRRTQRHSGSYRG